MTTQQFTAQLYREYDWRFDEVRALDNVICLQPPGDSRDDLRKSLILVLYAHFEGFCIFALEHYLTSVNSAQLACRDVVSAVLAGSWEKLFNSMQHGDEKSELFRSALPRDEDLHRHWRRRHFVEEMDRLLAERAKIPEDVLNTESNLKSHVLRRNLFILGLDHTFVASHADVLDRLVKRRNHIAHGDQRRGVREDEYRQFETAVFFICYQLIDFLEMSFGERAFEKIRPEFVV